MSCAAAAAPPSRRAPGRSCPSTFTASPRDMAALAGAGAAARLARRRGLRPGPRRTLRGRHLSAPWATSALSASTRPRTSAPAATAARSSPTTPRLADPLRRLRNYGQTRALSPRRARRQQPARRDPGGHPRRQARRTSTSTTRPAACSPPPTIELLAGLVTTPALGKPTGPTGGAPRLPPLRRSASRSATGSGGGWRRAASAR